MFSLKKLTMSAGAMLLLASAAFAQSGTVTVSGQNPEAFSLTDSTGAALSSTVTLGTLTPASNNTLTTGTATVRVRSNKAYKLSAQASALSFNTLAGDEGGDTIALTDIGFGITGSSLTGGNVVGSGSRSDSIVVGYSVPSGNWPAASGGLTPAFGKTLSNITGSTQIISGPRISRKGNLITTDNFIELTFGVATLPQFFTPNVSFQSVITLTLSAN